MSPVPWQHLLRHIHHLQAALGGGLIQLVARNFARFLTHFPVISKPQTPVLKHCGVKMACIPIPLCIECGNTDNPCRCKIIGPTLGFIGFVLAAVIEWPVGAAVWCCNHKSGERIMSHPAMVVRPSISNCIPF